MIHQALLTLSLVCFALSAFPVGAPFWNRLVSVGLASLALAFLIGAR